jgi:hypothetical protein
MRKSIGARIQFPRLKVNVSAGKSGQKEIDFGGDPGSVSARIMPIAASVEGFCRLNRLQGWMSPEEISA